MLDLGTGLPPPSPDYWELPETQTTLATAALLHAGLDAASGLYLAVNAASRSRAMAVERSRLAAAIERGFGRHGFPRSIGGNADTVDLGVCFLLPPFSDTGAADAAKVAAWREAPHRMWRDAGGLAPGGSWPDDGVSWNTATATYAMTAAFIGDRVAAVTWLSWLDDHRTRQGSLPEKVLHDGRPASVAPLAWAAAAVVLAASALEEGSGTPPVGAGRTEVPSRR
jgi:glucoamylase